MRKKKGKICLGFVLATLVLVFFFGNTSLASTTIGKTGVGVGFVEGSEKSSSSSTSNTDTSKSTGTTTTTDQTTESSDSSRNNTIRNISETPKSNNGSSVSTGTAKMLPSTGDRTMDFLIIIGCCVIVAVFVFKIRTKEGRDNEK